MARPGPDALPNIHFVMSMGIPVDVDSELTYDVQMALVLDEIHTVGPGGHFMDTR